MLPPISPIMQIWTGELSGQRMWVGNRYVDNFAYFQFQDQEISEVFSIGKSDFIWKRHKAINYKKLQKDYKRFSTDSRWSSKSVMESASLYRALLGHLE